MGVLACDRNGCDNIMCDRSDYQRYICDECFDELVSLGMHTDIDVFFNTPKRKFDRDAKHRATYNYFDEMFPAYKPSFD